MTGSPPGPPRRDAAVVRSGPRGLRRHGQAPGAGQAFIVRLGSRRPRSRRYAPPAGQASIELLGLLPLVALITLVAMTLIASHAAGEQAGEAAEAGALVLLQGGATDPRAAARASLGASTGKRATVAVSGRTVRVRVVPRLAVPIPGLADRLATTADADAGR